eukprot:TRINITY_DN3994_c0_g3_i1.p1 TRINITY_DN3994_c0_g3~~TRINITY_DN3994_c0_g3_i1.p1  ORF type:complete len:1016 (-),score=215.01 TRINITY_DN3994_c0_g3_i1:1061-4084(-)
MAETPRSAWDDPLSEDAHLTSLTAGTGLSALSTPRPVTDDSLREALDGANSPLDQTTTTPHDDYDDDDFITEETAISAETSPAVTERRFSTPSKSGSEKPSMTTVIVPATPVLTAAADVMNESHGSIDYDNYVDDTDQILADLDQKHPLSAGHLRARVNLDSPLSVDSTVDRGAISFASTAASETELRDDLTYSIDESAAVDFQSPKTPATLSKRNSFANTPTATPGQAAPTPQSRAQRPSVSSPTVTITMEDQIPTPPTVSRKQSLPKTPAARPSAPSTVESPVVAPAAVVSPATSPAATSTPSPMPRRTSVTKQPAPIATVTATATERTKPVVARPAISTTIRNVRTAAPAVTATSVTASKPSVTPAPAPTEAEQHAPPAKPKPTVRPTTAGKIRPLAPTLAGRGAARAAVTVSHIATTTATVQLKRPTTAPLRRKPEEPQLANEIEQQRKQLDSLKMRKDDKLTVRLPAAKAQVHSPDRDGLTSGSESEGVGKSRGGRTKRPTSARIITAAPVMRPLQAFQQMPRMPASVHTTRQTYSVYANPVRPRKRPSRRKKAVSHKQERDAEPQFSSPESVEPVPQDVSLDNEDIDMLPPLERLRKLRSDVLLFQSMNQLDKVIPTRIEVVALAHLIYGTKHVEMARAHLELSESYLNKNLAQQALLHAKRARDISVSVRDEPCRALHPAILLTLGSCLVLLNKFTEAHPVLRQALRATEALHGEKSSTLIPVYMAMAKLAFAEQQHETCVDWLLTALELAVNEYGQEHPTVASVYIEMAMVKCETRDEAAALQLLCKAHSIYSQTKGSLLNMKAAMVSQQIAQLHAKLGNFDDAESFAAQTATAFDVIYGDNDAKAVDAWRTVGMLQLKQRQYDQAGTVLSKVLEKEKQLFGLDSLLVADTSKLLGTVLLAQQQVTPALTHYNRSLRIYQTLLGDDNKRTRTLLKTIQTVKAHTEDTEEALLQRASAVRERLNASFDADLIRRGSVSIRSTLGGEPAWSPRMVVTPEQS